MRVEGVEEDLRELLVWVLDSGEEEGGMRRRTFRRTWWAECMVQMPRRWFGASFYSVKCERNFGVRVFE